MEQAKYEGRFGDIESILLPDATAWGATDPGMAAAAEVFRDYVSARGALADQAMLEIGSTMVEYGKVTAVGGALDIAIRAYNGDLHWDDSLAALPVFGKAASLIAEAKFLARLPGVGVVETTASRFAGMSSAERRVILEGKLEANAMRRLEEMQQATPGAHFVERHGSQLSLASQYDRAAFGINPTTGVVERIPSAATRFVSARDQLSAITRAEQIFVNTGDRLLARQPIGFGRVIGEGYNRSLTYGTQRSAQVFVNPQGRAVTAFPVYGF